MIGLRVHDAWVRQRERQQAIFIYTGQGHSFKYTKVRSPLQAHSHDFRAGGGHGFVSPLPISQLELGD